MRKTTSSATKDFDVVLSFAGEDRAVAQEIAEELRGRGVQVFFDQYEKAALWGENLYDYLSDVYQNRGYFCVMLISHHYARKLWTDHERRAAQARAFQEKYPYILPIRLDDTPVDGVLPTVSYLVWGEENGDTIAEAAVEKLHKLGVRKGGTTVKAALEQRTARAGVRTFNTKTAATVFTLAVVCVLSVLYYLAQRQGRENPGAATQAPQPTNLAAAVESNQAGVNLSPGYKFLSLKEGNPGAPGDNLFVTSLGEESKTVSGGMFYYKFSLRSPISIKGIRQGVTLALFLSPGVKTLEAFNNLQLDFNNLRPRGQCPFNAGGTASFKTRRVTVNNVQGLAFDITPTFVNSVGAAGDPNQPQCKMNTDELYLTSFALSSTTWNQAVPSLDAVAIAYDHAAVQTEGD